MTYDHLPYRPCVGLALFNDKGQVFVGERIDSLPGSAWQMPQGGIDEGETVQIAAMRELQEEAGTDKAKIIRIADETICYDLPVDRVPTFWNGRFRGQEQTWVALRFTGADSDIVLDAFNEPEFKSWKWVDLAQVVDLVVPFKRETYARVVAMFSDLTAD